MAKKSEISKILKVLQDYGKRIATLEGKKTDIRNNKTKLWYKPGSTTEKVASLLRDGRFNEPQTINDIISELQTKNYHLKASDLTLPLRRIVRKGLLKRTKIDAHGSPSKRWLYLKA